LNNYQKNHQPAQNPLATTTYSATRELSPRDVLKFPEPRLEANERTELNGFRSEEDQKLNTYGWVDQKEGVVHIPIEQAMQIVAQRGLPVRPPSASPEQVSGAQQKKQNSVEASWAAQVSCQADYNAKGKTVWSKAKLANPVFIGSFVLVLAIASWGKRCGAAELWHRRKPAPPGLANVGIEQRLNQQIPQHLTFHDETGKAVRLGDYFGKRPVILNLVYYNCQMLCGEVLSGLTSTLRVLSSMWDGNSMSSQ